MDWLDMLGMLFQLLELVALRTFKNINNEVRWSCVKDGAGKAWRWRIIIIARRHQTGPECQQHTFGSCSSFSTGGANLHGILYMYTVRRILGHQMLREKSWDNRFVNDRVLHILIRNPGAPHIVL
jgi:hypothetical protein